MRAIGIIRNELVAGVEYRDRFEAMLRRTAAGDGHELTQIFEYDTEDPTVTERMITAIRADGTDDVMVYAPWRAHLNGAETLILQHASLECVLDNMGWPRRDAR